ncbi:MAG: hypothetical protein WBQ10_14755 [Terriglobales bacterium]
MLNEAESIARDQLSSRLAPLVALTEQTGSLYERAMDAIAEHPRHGAAAKVGLILASRLTNDLRVCSLSAQLGYGIQALVVGATIVEVAGALAYVGDSVSRAARWAEHSDLRHAYPRKVEEGIEALLSSLGISSPGAKENWYQAYTFMCTAKHGNPRISMLHGLRINASGFSYQHGPDPSAFGVSISAEALYNAVFFGAPGVYVALGHCTEEVLRAQLRAEALRLIAALHGLELWFTELFKAGQEESARGVVSQVQTQAVVSQLNSETERLKRETERLSRETERGRRGSRPPLTQ